MILFAVPLFALAWRMWQGGGEAQGSLSLWTNDV